MTATAAESGWAQLIDRRDFRGWAGLPPRLSPAQVASRYPPAFEGEGTGVLGTRRIRATFTVHSADGYPHPLRAWSLDDQVILIDIDLPPLISSTQELLEDLGPPEAALEGAFGVLTVPGGLRVHAERGAAVFVGPEGQVLSLQLFPPTGLGDYLERLRPSSKLTERP